MWCVSHRIAVSFSFFRLNLSLTSNDSYDDQRRCGPPSHAARPSEKIHSILSPLHKRRRKISQHISGDGGDDYFSVSQVCAEFSNAISSSFSNLANVELWG